MSCSGISSSDELLCSLEVMFYTLRISSNFRLAWQNFANQVLISYYQLLVSSRSFMGIGYLILMHFTAEGRPFK